jgi:hypothetical protein
MVNYKISQLFGTNPNSNKSIEDERNRICFVQIAVLR